MLEDVEQFRQEYAYHYNLRECAMMLAEVRPGSFIVTWFIPESIVEKLKANVPRAVCKKYAVTELTIAGRCVYRVRRHQMPNENALFSGHTSTGRSAASIPAATLHGTDSPEGGAMGHARQLREQDYLFVAEPSKDFFCPVTYGLLLQPHLTECCGKHLSQEAVTRIQGEGKPCPMCNTAPFNMMLNKHFLRQVNELHVFCQFCHHEDRGCEWQGELSALEHHISTCHISPRDMSDTPSIMEQPKDPVFQFQDKEKISEDTYEAHTQYGSYTCQVSGPGLHSATANHPTHVLVELSDSSGRPCSLQQNVIAELALVSEATPRGGRCSHLVVATSPSQYKVSYTAVRRGQYKLRVHVNNREIEGSPFAVTVYPNPTQLGHPVRVVTGLSRPYGIACNKQGEMVISEYSGHQISIFNMRGQKIRTFGSRGDSPEQMIQPAGIAIDDADNIYVSSDHKLQKFNSDGKLIKCVGQRGSKEGEFHSPRGVTLHDNQVYVCDRNNHRIQVFDLDLNFIQSIGSHGTENGQLNCPLDVKVDTDGNIYVADYDSNRVQVLDINGQFKNAFGQEEKKGRGRLSRPSTLHILDKHVYVTDRENHCIVVYKTSGQFVTSFGRRGHKEGEMKAPRCITSCANGFIYVCDRDNDRVQIF